MYITDFITIVISSKCNRLVGKKSEHTINPRAEESVFKTEYLVYAVL